MDKPVAQRLINFLHDRLEKIEDPRSIGQALKGSKLGEFWKYRVGDYRLVAQIEDGVMRILVIKIGNRKEVYD
jgi:mRNA interferase RelE/StbE